MPPILKGIALICANENKEYLLHLRDAKAKTLPNEWCLVGGTIESGETPTAAAARELREETGLDAREVKLYREVHISSGKVAIFTAKVDGPLHEIRLTEGRGIVFLCRDEALSFLEWIDSSIGLNVFTRVLYDFLRRSIRESQLRG